MNATEAVNKIKLLLGLDNEVTHSTQINFASVMLLDGTEVQVEGEFEVGKVPFIVTEEGNIQCPAGVHETKDGQLITVDENGVITSIEEIEVEEVQPEVAVEEVAMAEEAVVEIETEEGKEEAMEEEPAMIVEEIVDALKPYLEGVELLKEKMAELEAKFQTFAKAPAAKPIKKVSEEFESNRIDRVARLSKIRK